MGALSGRIGAGSFLFLVFGPTVPSAKASILLQKLNLGSRAVYLLTLFAPALILTPLWQWQDFEQGTVLRWFTMVSAFMVAWKASTEDVDLAVGCTYRTERVLILVATALCWVSPAFLFPLLAMLSHPLNAWRHHATLPLRILAIAFGSAAGATLIQTAGFGTVPLGVFVFILLTVQISTYFVTALAKARLDDGIFGWVLKNRLHHLAASAYSWGWARFIPFRYYRWFIKFLKAVEKPFQWVAFAFELLIPFAFLEPNWAIPAFAVGAVFHVVVFVTSGIFWEWVAVDVATIFLIQQLSPESVALAFGWHALVGALLLMAVFPLARQALGPHSPGVVGYQLYPARLLANRGRKRQDLRAVQQFHVPPRAELRPGPRVLLGEAQVLYLSPGRSLAARPAGRHSAQPKATPMPLNRSATNGACPCTTPRWLPSTAVSWNAILPG